MPLFALAGIPWLAGLLGSLFSGIFTWVFQYFTKRLAVVLSGVVLVSGLTVALYSAFSGMVAALSYAAPDFVVGAAIFMPTNAQLCLSSWVTAKVLRWAYDWNVKIIQWKLGL